MNTIERITQLPIAEMRTLTRLVTGGDMDWARSQEALVKLENKGFVETIEYIEALGVHTYKATAFGAALVADYQQRQQMEKQVTDMLSEKDTVIGKMALDHVQLETELTAAKRRIAELEHQVKIADGVFERLGRYEEALRYIANGTLFGKTPKELANIALKGSQS